MRKILKIFAWGLGVLVAVLAIALAVLHQPDIPADVLKKKYAGPPSKFMEVKGMPVHYRDEGPATDSIPLVLLHGTGASLFTWDACTAEWSKTRRVIRMDLPGFGLTGPAPDEDYSIAAYVDFVKQVLQQLNVQQCHMAGNSLGGLVAYSLAAANPQMVQKLVLLDAAGFPIINGKGNLAFNLARTPVVKHVLKIVTPLSVVRKSIEDVYGNKALVTDALVEQYRDMACRAGNREALLVRLSKPQEGDTTLVKSLHMPVMVIWGDMDFLIPLDNAYKFQRDLPNDTLVIMKGIGHVPMEENPAAVIPLVANFLR